MLNKNEKQLVKEYAKKLISKRKLNEAANPIVFTDRRKQADFDKMILTYPEVKKIVEKVVTVLQQKGLYTSSLVTFDNKSPHPIIHFEPSTRVSDLYDGMIMTYSPADKSFEVSENGAGEKQNELHIYTDTKSLSAALKSLLQGNKNRKPIKIWD